MLAWASTIGEAQVFGTPALSGARAVYALQLIEVFAVDFGVRAEKVEVRP